MRANLTAEDLLDLILLTRERWLSNPVKYITDPRPLPQQWFHHRSTYRKNFVVTDSASIVRALKWSLIVYKVTLPEELEVMSSSIAGELIRRTSSFGAANQKQMSLCQTGLSYEVCDAIHATVDQRIERDCFWSVKR
jgi:hypothetical protein